MRHDMHNDYSDIISSLRSSDNDPLAEARRRNRMVMAIRAAHRSGVSIEILSQETGKTIDELYLMLDEERMTDRALTALETA